MKTKVAGLLLLILLSSCNKNADIILDSNLTGCPVNSTCTYNYADNSDLSGEFQVIAGNYRVFEYQSVNKNLCNLTIGLNLKIPQGNSTFLINSNQIIGGQLVSYYTICACCDLVANLNPIGGEIKGKIIDGHWLINAKVIIGTAPNKPLDTLIVNQYFSKK